MFIEQNPIPEAIAELPIDTLQFPLRVHNALVRARYTTVGRIFQANPEEITAIHNVGVQAIVEVQQRLEWLRNLLAEQGAEVVFRLLAPPKILLKQSLPQPLMMSPLNHLGLSSRTLNALSGASIYTISDLLSASSEVLSQAQGLGQQSRDEIQAVLDRLLTDPQDAISISQNSTDTRPLLVNIAEDEQPNLVKLIVSITKAILIADNQERRFDVLKRRYGLESSKTYTLQDIGEYYGLTRERVRQLEKRGFETIRDLLLGETQRREWRLPSVLICEILDLKALLEQQESVIMESNIFTLLEQRYQIIIPQSDINNIRFLLSLFDLKFYDSNTFGCTTYPLWVRGEIDKNSIESILQIADTLLESGSPVLFFDIKVAVNRKRKNRLDNDEIIHALALSPKFERVDGEELVYRRPFMILVSHADRAFRVLSEAGQPLHLREIARQVNQRMANAGHPANIPWRSIQSQVVGDSRFKNIGRSGNWALTTWEHIVTEPIRQGSQILYSSTPPSPPASGGEPMRYPPPLAGGLGGVTMPRV